MAEPEESVWSPPGLTEMKFQGGAGTAAALFPNRCEQFDSRCGNRFDVLQRKVGDDRTSMTWVDDENVTREAQLEFFEADVRKPLVSAVRVAKAKKVFRSRNKPGLTETKFQTSRKGASR